MPKSTAKHKVALTADQRADLERMTRQKSIGVAKKRWATILLLADEVHSGSRGRDERLPGDRPYLSKKTNCSRGRPNGSASPRTTGRDSSPRWRPPSTFTKPPTTRTTTNARVKLKAL